ncbi:MAG: Gx transporter family protein [Oscillospiraceae bacterium]|nr:Gx transporter family protein [Oscillospiraceae bacterium]
MRKEQIRTRRVALLGILAALTLTLSFLESLLPPLPYLPPGAKPGLANIAVLFTALSLDWSAALALTLLKAMFALVTRGTTAALLSLAGGLLSTGVMLLLLRVPKLGLLGVSILSAVAHNAGQLLAACVLMGTSKLAVAAPVLLVFSLLAGALTGTVSKILLPVLSREE